MLVRESSEVLVSLPKVGGADYAQLSRLFAAALLPGNAIVTSSPIGNYAEICG